MDFEPEGRPSPHSGYLIPAGEIQAEILLKPDFQRIWLLDANGKEITTDPAACRGLVIQRDQEEFWFARETGGSFWATELRDAHEMGLKGRLLLRDCPDAVTAGGADTVFRIDQARAQYARHGGRVYANADYLIEAVREDSVVKFYLSSPEKPAIDVNETTFIFLYDRDGHTLPIARSTDGSCLYARVPARPGHGRLMFHIFNEDLDLQVEW